MIGWLVLALLVAASFAALWLLGARGGLLQAGAAALLFGSAGYALQGRPGLAGAPAQGSAANDAVPLAEARHAFFGNFGAAESWLRMSEALASRGHTEDAANLLGSAVRAHPRDPQLWIGFANALVDHAHGLTPPAELAYRRAAALAPGHPAAPFFYGLALARSGDREGAVAIWREILAKAPRDASWRPMVEAGIAVLNRTAAIGSAPARGQSPPEAPPR
jgi:cytochrome c-type biogenesis protein CcmH